MSEENLNLVRSIHSEWERGDYSSADWADPEIEYVHADGPEIGTWNGLAGMSEGFRQFLRAWEDFCVEAEEFRALDADRVLVLFNFTGRGKRSGLEAQEIRTKGAQLFQIRGGKVTRLVQYLNRDDAFADLGIETDPCVLSVTVTSRERSGLPFLSEAEAGPTPAARRLRGLDPTRRNP